MKKILIVDDDQHINEMLRKRLTEDDRFYTVEAAHHSTGLGLSIVRTLMERMHGSVNATYEEGCLSIRIELGEEGSDGSKRRK